MESRDQTFYLGELEDDRSTHAHPRVLGFPWPQDAAVALVDVRTQEESCGTRWSNEAEALVVRRIIDGVRHADPLSESRIAVITPFDAQRRLLRDTLGEGPQVSSVNSWGREEDLVIVSMTRANDCGGVGFAKVARRLNVALARARRGLIVIGDFETLCAGDAGGLLLDIVTDCMRRGLLLTGDLKPRHQIPHARQRCGAWGQAAGRTKLYSWPFHAQEQEPQARVEHRRRE